MDVFCFDFDGVICDSAGETGAAGWRAAAQLWPERFAGEAPADYLEQYRAVRPVLETGYESIVLARLLADGVPVEAILAEAPRLVKEAMAREGLEKERLIALFSEVRDSWLRDDLPGWLELNGFYDGVPATVSGLAAADAVFIITTKQHRYAMALLERAGIDLPPERVFGLEAGKKTDVLAKLLADPAWAEATFHFFEDRLPTLEKVAAAPGLDAVKLYLASWGYTTPAEVAAAARLSRVTILTREEFVSRFARSTEPVAEVTIDDVAYGGDGVGRVAGKAVFVPFTAIGDRVRVRIVEDRKKFARAELLDLLTPGPGRTEPRCRHFGTCGGCQYQHLTYEEQLRLKTQQLAATMTRIGGLEACPEVSPVVGSTPYGYRNKIELHPVQGAEPAAYGYVTTDHVTVTPVSECPLAAPPLEAALRELKPEEVKHASLTLRMGENGHVYHYHGRSPRRNLWLRETWRGQKLNQPLGSFAQVNREIATKLVAWLAEVAAEAAPEEIVDLYCGAGLFALNLGHLPKRLTGIEQDAEGIRAARFTAKKWGLGQAHFLSGAVEQRLAKVLAGLKAPEKTLVVVDPPRAGLTPQVVDLLARHRPARIVYVSCEASGQARDLKRLMGRAPYRLERLALFDMFPQTGHFESVACLRLDG